MPTDIYTQTIDDTETPLRIEWQVEWEVVRSSFYWFPGCRWEAKHRVNVKELNMLGASIELTPGCWHHIDHYPRYVGEGKSGGTAEPHYRKKLDMELVQAFCQECFDKNPKLYTEAA